MENNCLLAIKAWKAAVPHPLPEGIEDRLMAWKKMVLSGGFEQFTKGYQGFVESPGVLGSRPRRPQPGRYHANLSCQSGQVQYHPHRLQDGRHAWRKLGRLELIGEDLQGINAFQITTIQQAKGLEWRIVFMPSLMSNRFPSKNTQKQKRIMIGRDLSDAARYEGLI